VLLPAAGRSTRSIAAEVGVRPRIVSNCRRLFAEEGLDSFRTGGRGDKKPICGQATNKRMLALLDESPCRVALWTGPLLAKALADVNVQYVSRFPREHKIDLAARESWRERGRSRIVRNTFDPAAGTHARVLEAAERTPPDRPQQ
jgi:hypothetical protein